MSGWIDEARSHQEAASYTWQPRRDLVAESIARTQARIAECFAGLPKFKAKIKEPTQ